MAFATTNITPRMEIMQENVGTALQKWLNAWTTVLGVREVYFTVKWERDVMRHGYILAVVIDDWVTHMIVDDAVFEQAHGDSDYLHYLGNTVLVQSQTGVIMRWLHGLFKTTEDTHDLGKIWAENLANTVKEAHFRRKPSLANGIHASDLVDLVVKDNPVPLTMTVKEIMDEPKLLLARLTMMKP